MYVHLTAAVIAQLEIPRAVTYDFTIATRFECGAIRLFPRWQCPSLYVGGLRTEEGGNTPTAVNPYTYAQGVQLGI
jgi:hypothetical protein